MVIGGTSAVAPLWAGLIAVANQQLGTTVGFIQLAIYAAKAASDFNDITKGNNGAFSAGPGWDACTGLGSPIAIKLIPLLAPVGSGVTAPSKPPAKPVKKRKKPVNTKIVFKKAAKKL
jgi:kumamolisin